MGMPIGMILLILVSVLVFFGVAHRLLDRMRLTDKQALWVIGAIVVGSYINIPLIQEPVRVSINVGGAVIPAVLCIYLMVKADETYERVRAIAASLLVAVAVGLGSLYLPHEPETMFMDPKLIYGVVAGLIAYLAGRSRRSAFIGGILGILLSDIWHLATLLRSGIAGTTSLGGAGAFDVVLIAGLVAVMTAELVGETRERLQGGPVLGPNRPEGLYEFSKELTPERKLGEKRRQEQMDQIMNRELEKMDDKEDENRAK